MEDALFQSSALDINEQIRLPETEFFIPESYRRMQVEEQLSQKVAGASSIVISDGDLDGLGAAAAHFAVFPDSVFISGGPHAGVVDIHTALKLVSLYAQPDCTVTVADISLNSKEQASLLPEVADKASEVFWFDHHEWGSTEVKDFVRTHTDRFVVDDGVDEKENGVLVEANARCAAQVTADELSEEYEYSYSSSFRDGLTAIAARDLWRKDENGDFVHPQTEALNAFAVNVASSAQSPYDGGAFSEFIYPFIEDGSQVVTQRTVARRIDAQRETTEAKIDAVLASLEDISTTGTVTVNGEDIEVIVVYGNYPTSDLSDELNSRAYDLVVTLTPRGKISFRSTGNFPHSNTLAYEFNGGGHAQAAGGFIGEQFTTIVDYIDYWGSNGETQREQMLEDIQRIVTNKVED